MGFDLTDDAGVYLLDDETALVQTVDVITPLVDDPRTFGRIAAANALSDVYAMGAKPINALNIVSFPDKDLPLAVLSTILKGGIDACNKAKCLLLGGHTLRDDEVKYGLAVTGIVHPDEIITNDNARPGDVLVLTKPIGTGLISTALKRDKVSEKSMKEAIGSMRVLNDGAARAMKETGVNACTDVTGFGLAGHASHIARASEVTLTIEADKIPLLAGAPALAKKGMAPGGTKSNIKAYKKSMRLPRNYDDWKLDILLDPQTSGGLLISVPEKRASKLVKALKLFKTPAAKIIGKVGRKIKGVHIKII